MAKLGEKFDMFGDATEPRADGGQRTEKPAETPVPVGKPERPAKSARTARSAEVSEELDKEELGDWRWRLSATAGKAVKAQQRANEAARAWERVVTEARNAGVPERLLMAAALEADMDLPAAE